MGADRCSQDAWRRPARRGLPPPIASSGVTATGATVYPLPGRGRFSNHQGKGLGAELLADALSRVQLASAHVAVRAVVVHAVDDRAAGFYERFGFRALTSTPRTLMVTLSDLRAAGY